MHFRLEETKNKYLIFPLMLLLLLLHFVLKMAF